MSIHSSASEKKYQVERRIETLLSKAERTKLVKESKLKSCLESQSVSDLNSVPHISHSHRSMHTNRSVHTNRSAYSHRSNDDDSISSLGSEDTRYSYRGHLTMREQIRQLESHRSDEGSDGESSRQKLPPELISWNRKKPKKQKALAKINIIPCHHSVELILALADDRIRKRQRAAYLRQKKCEDEAKHINEIVEHTKTRAERITEKMKIQQQQHMWIKFIKCVTYGHMVDLSSRNILQLLRTNNQRTAASTRIQRWYFTQKEKRIVKQYIQFLKRFKNVQWIVVLRLTILHKRRACKIIKTTLNEFRERQQVLLDI